ncbi:MAG: hypothetical protein U0835_09605 [Isosphaeraceae bacterium]
MPTSPPLDIPRDPARAGESASRPGKTSRPSPAPTPEPEEESVVDNPPAPAAEPAPTVATASVAPGIRRFSGVGPKLAGGSLPTAAGLDWLSETGYRTILDLRENVQADPTFAAEAGRRGLRYVSLPVSLENIDLNLVSRFRSELAVSDSASPFFCDTDGTRA